MLETEVRGLSTKGPETREDEDRQIALLWYEERVRLLPEFKKTSAAKTRQSKESIETTDGRRIKISEIVMLIKDHQGKTLFIVDQDPFAKEEIIEGVLKRPVLRTPVQTNVETLRQLKAGNKEVSPMLYEVLGELSSGKEGVEDVIEKTILGKVSSRKSVRLLNTYYGTIKVDNKTANTLEATTGGMFLSGYQMWILNQEINGHTHTALASK